MQKLADVAGTTDCNVNFCFKKKEGIVKHWSPGAPWTIHHDDHVASMKPDKATHPCIHQTAVHIFYLKFNREFHQECRK
jgi:hypothetical protein